MYQLAQKL